jgi:hypothetical protein
VGQSVVELVGWTPVEVVKMNGIEKARGNIETLKDSLVIDWNDLALPLTGAERIDIETHPEWCLAEMSWCLADMKNHLSAAEVQAPTRTPLRPFDPRGASTAAANRRTATWPVAHSHRIHRQ